MEEDEDTPVTLLTHCRFTVCEKIPSDDHSLNSFLTDTLQFEITGFDPLVIEKHCPSLDDINKLLARLKTSLHSQRDLIDLEQKKGNVSCEGLIQKSLLQVEGANRQSTEHLVESNCEDHCSYETSSQVQDSNADVQDLTSSFQSLKVDDDHVEKNEFEKSLSAIAVVPELTSVTVVHETIAENVSSTEKSGKISQVEWEHSNQVEKTQKDLHRKQDSVTGCGYETMQNIPIATENEIEYRDSQKQDSQDMEKISKNERKLNTDNHEVDTQTKLTAQKNNSGQETNMSTDVNIQLNEDKKNRNSESVLIEQPCRKSTDHVKCDEDAGPRSEKTITTHDLTTSGQERPCRQNNDSVSSSSEVHKMEDDFKFIKESGEQSMIHSQDIKTYPEHRVPLRTDFSRTRINNTENANEKQHIDISEDAKISKDIMIHEDYKSENHSIISGDSTDTSKRSFNYEMSGGCDKSNYASFPAVRSRKADKQELKEEKNENPEDISGEMISKQKVEIGKGQARLISDENFHPSHDCDVGNQEHSNRISLSEESEGESQIHRKRETLPFSPRSHAFQDSAEYPDSDAESEYDLTYSMKASSLDGLRMFYKESVYDKYFDDAKSYGTGFIFRLNSSDKNAVSFYNTLKQLKVEECEFGHKDYLEAAVKDILAKIEGLVIQVKGSTVHIVGLRDSVTSAKRKLSSRLQNRKQNINQHLDMIKTNERSGTKEESLTKNSPIPWKNQEVPRNEISDSRKTHVMVTSQESEYETHLEEPQSPRLGRDFSFHSSSLPVKNNHFGENERDIFSQNNKNYYLTTEPSTFRVTIYKTDITKLEVDCVVNAANKRLQHYGGVAKAISSAAGPALNKECEAFRDSGNLVGVTDIFISTAGKMPAKCVMHAVGPKWDDYNSKPRCFDDLRHTVIRCLVEAGRQGFTSIAFPSISAAVFKVPKEECARCYMEAVKHFGKFNKERTSLHEIYFVDVDDSMVKIIQDHFENNWTNPCNPHIVQRDCDFANTHVYSRTRNATKNSEKSSYTDKTASSSLSSKTPGVSRPSFVSGHSSTGSTVSSTSEKRREESSGYQIGNFTLYTKSRPAFDLSSDITITVGKPFDKLSGLYGFNLSDNKKNEGNLKNKYSLFTVSKPKSQQQKQICSLLPNPDDADKIKEALGNLHTILQSPNHKVFAKSIEKVVLTSSILYNEPDNKDRKNKNCFDRKKIGDFARFLFDYLKSAQRIADSPISVTLVGSEEALLIIRKVIESRDVMLVPTGAQQGAWSKTSGGSQHSHQEGYSEKYSGIATQGNDYTRKHHEEVHQGARSKTTEGSQYRYRGSHSEQESWRAGQGSDYPRHHFKEDNGSSVDLETTCEICVSEKHPFPVKCCGKFICLDCQQRLQICPFCRSLWKVLTGDQPPGTMKVRLNFDFAEGYENARVWEIEYSFPSGFQMACHPNPGAPYGSMIRRAFLPANEDGLYVLKLLRLAFFRKLIFTIGHSLTMDKENCIIWNDIHHKTRLHGGPYGYPDSNYLLNVTKELASKGVTFDKVSREEMVDLEDFTIHILKMGHFMDYRPR